MERPLEALMAALEKGDLDRARQAARQLERGGGAGQTQLAAEVLHELRQPLLGIKAYAQLMSEEAPADGPLHLLLAQVVRMEQIISDFTRLASNRQAPKEPVDLAKHVREAERLFRVNPDSARITLEVDAPQPVELSGNGRLLEQLVLNLLNNARDAMGGLGRLGVRVRREEGHPVLYVADWGPGIPAHMRERIFQPYVTDKARGSGLGLAVCQRIAQEHSAQLSLAEPSSWVAASPPATVFRVVFPAPQAATAQKRLLVVDDEEVIRRVFRDLMRKECEVVLTATAEEALEELGRGRFDLIVTDKNMPGLSGLELALEARRRDPASRVILMTGYPSLVTAQQAVELGILDYLLKPFDDIREVRAKLREALAGPAPAPAAVGPGAAPSTRRVDVYEDNPASARQISDALSQLGYEARLHTEATPPQEPRPAAVVVSWDFTPAHGKEAVALGKRFAQGTPFVVLAEHLTMEAVVECLRGGAAGCLPKLLSDATALARELSRALKLATP